MTSSKKHDENVDQTQFGVNAKEDGALNLGKSVSFDSGACCDSELAPRLS